MLSSLGIRNYLNPCLLFPLSELTRNFKISREIEQYLSDTEYNTTIMLCGPT